MGGSFEGVYTGDEGLAKNPEYSMLNAMGSAGETKGTELESPEENFIGSQMSPGALADPGNALPSAGGLAKPPEGMDTFDCLADKLPKE